MIIKNAILTLTALAVLAGCSAGSAPETMTPEDVKATVDKMPIDQQIDYIQRSPLPPAEKEKRINELKAKKGS